MFSKIRKSKTLRSLLGAASIFAVGMPTVTEAAPKPPQRLVSVNKAEQDKLTQMYLPLCEQLEGGNVPYCYYGFSGSVTVGCGVHVHNFSQLKNLPALKVHLKKGYCFSLKKKDLLRKIADADWQKPETKKQFPFIEKVESISVNNCVGKCPKSTASSWQKPLFLLPTKTLRQVNKCAVDFYVQKAYQYHPNLFQFSPSAQVVIVDLLYNLGEGKYRRVFKKFRKAVQQKNLKEMYKECQTKNARRNAVRENLMNSAFLINMYEPFFTEAFIHDHLARVCVSKYAKMGPASEGALWRAMDSISAQDLKWQQTKIQSLAFKPSFSVKKNPKIR